VKLIAAMLALVMIALLVIGMVSALALRRYLIGRVDYQLKTNGATVDVRQLQTSSIMPTDYLVAYGNGREFVTWAYRPAAGRPVMPNESQLRKRANRPYTASSVSTSERWRLLIIPAAQDPSGAEMYLIIGESLRDMDDAVDRLVAAELIVGLGVLAILASVGVGIVQASLRPLTEIEHTAAAIAAGDLTRRVPESDMDTEVGRLAYALNTMLAQIESAFAVRTASEERMRQFIADASHELRTPLTTIRGFAELYRQGAVRSAEDTAALLQRIEGEAARMGLLVEDLLLLARLDQERPLTLAPVELRVLASDAVSAASAVAPERRITLEAVGEPVLVVGDEPRLRQVLGNLMTNALTHTPAGTPVTVRVYFDPPHAVVEVADAGPGLTGEQRQRVFERFYRVDKARTRKAAGQAQAVAPHSGSGLGLAIVAALVAAHGGTVSVDSEPGVGATFRVCLPAGAPAVGHPDDATVDARPPGPPTAPAAEQAGG
jgi:two-component system OmpR family sensor kinase